MDIKTILSLVLAGINFVIACVSVIRSVVVSIKNKNWNALRVEMKTQIIPLMEQAEKILKDPTEKENWVIKKLSDMTHIDFYKYQNILSLAKDIIKEICETTKIEVNKIRVVAEKEEITETKGSLTNGIS